MELWTGRRDSLRERLKNAEPADAARILAGALRDLGQAYTTGDLQRIGAAHALAVVTSAAQLLTATGAVAGVDRGGGRRAALVPRPGLSLMTLTAAVLAAIMFLTADLAGGLALAFVAVLGVLALAGSAGEWLASAQAGSLRNKLPWRLRMLVGRRRSTARASADDVSLRYRVDVDAVLACVDDAIAAADRLVAGLRPAAAPTSDERWPDSLLSAYRELVAATTMRDAELALLGAEQLRGALAALGIVAVEHGETQEHWFEITPAGPGGPRTIRPALIRAGDPAELLSKGIHQR
ncbi:hypothetical protein AB0J72_31530 [Dactylosporangium sp. NPDC049742]|uniref:hypothetical protein n=1 Tax=Dactylosporangium sp. NPDC049742 TaxID=3154737 RepID=UPI0034371FC4